MPAGVHLPPSGMVETLQTGFGLSGATANSGGDQLSSLYECWSSQRQLCGATSLLSTLQWAMLEEINFPKSPIVSGPPPTSAASAVPRGCGAFWSLLGSAVSALTCSGDVIAESTGFVPTSSPWHPHPHELAVSEAHVLAS